MKIVFRVNYSTVPGQSLWIKLRSGADAKTPQLLPMLWINMEQWELEWESASDGPVKIGYTYQLREEGNGLILDEWGDWRELESGAAAVLLLRDTWRSAGTIDYSFETKAFRQLLPQRGPFAQPHRSGKASHAFGIHVAAVPSGCKVCLCGDLPELGAWDGAKAILLDEVAANEWRVDLTLPQGGVIAYKYGIYDPASRSLVDLEKGDNRLLEAHDLGTSQWTRVLDEGYRRDEASLFHGAGLAVPVFSLRSDKGMGVGEFADLKDLADWAQSAGLGMIQILPVNDTTSSHDWTDSYPYSAISVFALHPIYLRIDDLGYAMPPESAIEWKAARTSLNRLPQVDHRAVMQAKWQFTREIFDQHHAAILATGDFQSFLAKHHEWLVPYAAFCVCRDDFGTADFSRWGEWAAFDRQRAESLLEKSHPKCLVMFYHIWLQYELDRQLLDATAHLHARGVVLKGDLPIGIDRQSADAWSAAHLFNLQAQAGAPPDAFAEKGQNWGFPTYNWERMREDGYAWWSARFRHLSEYFDAFRIDHVLGFFRIWQVPIDQVEGIMGWFDPAQPVHVDEFRERGIAFDHDRFCVPHLPNALLVERFGVDAKEVIAHYLIAQSDGGYRLREEFATQRQIVEHFAKQVAATPQERQSLEKIRQGLMDCVSEVLFFEVPGSERTLYHPRFFMHKTRSFEDLAEPIKERIDGLYVDYFFRRQDFYWKARGYEKLPAMRSASTMLLCGEDLGMVPDCVPGVLRELGILSLEIQRMPKSSAQEFGDPAKAPYLSVVSPSTHDMPTLREWWQEERRVTERFAWLEFGEANPAEVLSGEMAARIVRQHLASPAMWAVIPLQDLLAMDEGIRHPDATAERINVPAIMPYEWRYRMHLDLDQLAAAEGLRHQIQCLVADSGRAGSSGA